MKRTTILLMAAVATTTTSCREAPSGATSTQPSLQNASGVSASASPENADGETARWNRYTNKRFDYAITVPGDFAADEAPTNDDGRVFRKGDATLRVFGAHNVLDSSFADQIAQASEGLSDVTVAARSDHRWRAMATTSDGWKVDILLLRPSADKLVTARFSYPTGRSKRFGAIAERSLGSLRSPV